MIETCPDCGQEIQDLRGQYEYYSAPGVKIILDDVVIHRCGCDEDGVSIERPSQLNRTIAKMIAGERKRLVGGEIRFLRKYLGWSGADFAREFAVDPSTVSRWENAAHPTMNARAESLLRVCVLTMEPVDQYPLPKDLEKTPEPKKHVMHSASREWRARP